MNTLNNVISENQTIENLFNQLKNVNGISLTKNQKLIKPKTSKQKLLFSIRKEIEILKNRNNLELKTFKKGDSYTNLKGEIEYYKNNRIENRFHKNPINNIVSFNLKYKGKIVPINNNNESFSCKNSVDILIINYNKFYQIIENLDDNHQLFQLDLFKSKSNK